MRSERHHTKFVKLAKVLLPLAALVLLSTIFLISDRVDPTRVPLYSDVDVDQMVREQRIGAPRYSGVTEDGDTLSVQASAAYPDLNGTTGMSAKDIVARLVSPKGETADMRSDKGQITPDKTQITLLGNVRMKTSTGYALDTSTATMATDRSTVTMPEAVSGSAPYGTLDAGAAQMSRASADAPYDLVFTGGVKLVYQPH